MSIVTLEAKKVESYVPSDVIASVLCFLKGNLFTGDPERIHSAIARLRRYYPLLASFTFTKGDVYPFSRLLEDSLSILQRSRIIRMENPDYDTYLIGSEAKKYIKDNILKRFTEDERSQLEELAKTFEAECGKTS